MRLGAPTIDELGGWRAHQAFGLSDVGGVMDRPVTDTAVGYDDWGAMSGMTPAHPLVGGSAGSPGYGSYATRQVAVAAPDPTQGVASGSPMRAHWSELFNVKGNPIGWVLIAAVLYLGLAHIHARVGASGGFGIGKGR